MMAQRDLKAVAMRAAKRAMQASREKRAAKRLAGSGSEPDATGTPGKRPRKTSPGAGISPPADGTSTPAPAANEASPMQCSPDNQQNRAKSGTSVQPTHGEASPLEDSPDKHIQPGSKLGSSSAKLKRYRRALDSESDSDTDAMPAGQDESISRPLRISAAAPSTDKQPDLDPGMQKTTVAAANAKEWRRKYERLQTEAQEQVLLTSDLLHIYLAFHRVIETICHQATFLIL